MGRSDGDAPREAAPLTEDERAAAFAPGARVDHAAALRAGRTPVPPKFIMWILVGFVVLGLGGALIEHFYGSVGLPTSKTTKVVVPTSSLTPVSSQASPSLAQFINLKLISNAVAPRFTLESQAGRKWRLTSAKGKVVVLTFENSICNDICPVVGAEIKRARALLGADAAKVVFVIVNSDPRRLGSIPSPLALSVPHLLTTPNVYFLTSSLAALDAVWTNYGLKVTVGAKADEVSHNNLMYFIDPAGHLAGVATPFAHVSAQGVFTLKTSYVDRFAKGVAETADSLVK